MTNYGPGPPPTQHQHPPHQPPPPPAPEQSYTRNGYCGRRMLPDQNVAVQKKPWHALLTGWSTDDLTLTRTNTDTAAVNTNHAHYNGVANNGYPGPGIIFEHNNIRIINSVTCHVIRICVAAVWHIIIICVPWGPLTLLLIYNTDIKLCSGYRKDTQIVRQPRQLPMVPSSHLNKNLTNQRSLPEDYSDSYLRESYSSKFTSYLRKVIAFPYNIYTHTHKTINII